MDCSSKLIVVLVEARIVDASQGSSFDRVIDLFYYCAVSSPQARILEGRTRSKISVRIWTADPSRLASLLVVAIRRVFLLLAPRQPGASTAQIHTSIFSRVRSRSGGDGNVGIMRSPVRAIVIPDLQAEVQGGGRRDRCRPPINVGFALRAKRGESSFPSPTSKARHAPSPFGALAARSPRRFRTHPGGEVPSSGYAKSTINLQPATCNLQPADILGCGRSPRCGELEGGCARRFIRSRP